jgi:hypothetical protein
MHPQDVDLFSDEQLDSLRRAVVDMSFLLTRNYPDKAALKLVGDRYALTVRQRQAVSRGACSDASRLDRLSKELRDPQELKSARLAIDGFNCLITVESALSGGLIIVGRDSAHRDLASIHGTYKKVDETLPAVLLIGHCLESLDLTTVTWFLDSPMSNAGRLAQSLRQTAQEHGWPWQVVLSANPDSLLVEADAVVASSDSWILDRCVQWIDLPNMVMLRARDAIHARVVDFDEGGDDNAVRSR